MPSTLSAKGALSGPTSALASGDVQVIDLTALLAPSTPVLGLPPDMAPIPHLELEELARWSGSPARVPALVENGAGR